MLVKLAKNLYRNTYWINMMDLLSIPTFQVAMIKALNLISIGLIRTSCYIPS